MTESLERMVAARLEPLGYELVELERGGTKARPMLRVRIDLPDSESGKGVTLEDCTRASRALEEVLDGREDVGERYVLEVSSPGLERPLVRRRDYERFAGRQVSLRGKEILAANSRRLEGELLGLSEAEGGDVVRLRLASGEEVAVPLGRVTRAQLVYRWGE